MSITLALCLAHSIHSIRSQHLYLKMGFSVKTAKLSSILIHGYFLQNFEIIKLGKDHYTDQLANVLL